MTKRMVRLCGAAMLAAAAAVPAAAGPYAGNVIFGDSLSDNGNLADGLGKNFASPPFYHDSFTNGEVAVAVLDDHLGLTTNPSLFPTGGYDLHNLGLTRGNNYAVAGATSGEVPPLQGGVPGGNLTGQVTAFLTGTGGIAPASDLYTVFIGGNDVRVAAHNNEPDLVTSGVATELAAIGKLLIAGATNFLVVNVPDIGAIPETKLAYPATAAAATADTDAYNALLLAGVNSLRGANPKANIAFFDLNAFSKNLNSNLSAYGITDNTTPCFSYPSVVTTNGSPYTTSAACAAGGDPTGNIDHLAFWDAIHPTARVQGLIGDALYQTVISAVPEPASWATMMIGFGMLGAGLRRRRVRVRATVLAA